MQCRAERVRCLTVGQPRKGLQHHHRSDHIGGHRRAAPRRRKQISEQVVGAQLALVISE